MMEKHGDITDATPGEIVPPDAPKQADDKTGHPATRAAEAVKSGTTKDKK